MLKTVGLRTGIKTLALASVMTFSPCIRLADKVVKDMPYNSVELMNTSKSFAALNDGINVRMPNIGLSQDSFVLGCVNDLTQKYDEPFLAQISDFASEKWLGLFHDDKIKSAQDLIKDFEAGDIFAKNIRGEKHYGVYYGKADKIADDNLRKQGTDVLDLLTVGHGHSQRGGISIGGQKLKEGAYITEHQADSLLDVDLQGKIAILDSFINKPVSKHERDATLSYMFNVDWKTLAKSDSLRRVKESFFECFNQGKKGFVQSKFNIVDAGGVEQPGLIQRRLVEMVIFGNGEIYKDKEAQATFVALVKKLNNKKGVKGVNQVVQTLKNYGIEGNKTRKIKSQMLAIIHPKED